MKLPALTALLVAATSLGQVSATLETAPIAANPTNHDVAIWVHPTDVSRSLIYATNDLGGLDSYGLDAGRHPTTQSVGTRAVDVRYRVPLNGGRTDVLVSVDINGDYRLFSPDPDGGLLTVVDEGTTSAGFSPNAGALYFNPRTHLLSVFIGSGGGALKQWNVSDNDAGQLRSTVVRALTLPRSIEGIAADDRTGNLFVTLASLGLYRIAADADAGDTVFEVDTLDGGHLVTPGGVALQHAAGNAGYLLVSSSTTSALAVYSLGSGYPFVTSFSIIRDAGTPGGVAHTTGIESVSLSLGAPFTTGLFVAADPATINNKLVKWGDLAAAVTPALAVSPTLDPRTSYGLDLSSLPDASVLCPIVPADGGLDAGPTADGGQDAGCKSGAGGGGGSVVIPPGGGGFPPDPKSGCGCGEAVMLFPLAALAWLQRPLRRRRPSKE